MKPHRDTKYLSREQMDELTTERLLAYRKSLLTNPEWRSWPDYIDPDWQVEHARALRESKELLDARKHVEKKPK